MGKQKDWVEEIGNIELEISYTSGVYDLAFLMGYGWYEEVEKIVEQIKQESREEGRREVYKAIVFDENIPHDITTFVAANLWKNMRDKAKEELSKLKDNK